MSTTHLPCGIEIPQVFFDGPVDMEHIRTFVIKAETLGYDSLWLQERIIGGFSMLEPVTLLSYVAAITNKLTIRNLCYSAAIAKSFATGESLLDPGCHEWRSCGYGSWARRRSSWVA